MVEQLIIDLFFEHHPDAEGVLGEEKVSKLNHMLARLHIERMGNESAPLPEPLPKASMRFPAFRSNINRALAGLGADAPEKARLLADLVSQVRLAEELTAPESLEVKGGLDNGLLQKHPAGDREMNIFDDAPVEVSCWDPSMIAETQKQRLQPYINAVVAATNIEATQKTLEAAKTWGALAFKSSKQVLENAKEYGLQALVGVQSFGEQLRAADEEYCTIHPGRRQTPRARRTVESEPSLEPEQRKQVRFDLSSSPPAQPFEQHRAQAAFRQHPQQVAYRTKTADFGRSDMQQLAHRTQTAEFGTADMDQVACRTPLPRFGRPDESDAPTAWRFDAGDGLHMDIRAEPSVGAARTGERLFPGEEFQVSQELQDRDGVFHLRLADGRGWVFDKKPGIGKMCFRTSSSA
mmetsp:Transcript_17760/g.44975  ORF Transcript_17760/g.44975 Transcript_17760/m.44975 type:complete len:407 (-) Transcript_17760:371-1591(-)